LEKQDNSFQVELFDRLPDDLIVQILLRTIADRHHPLDDAAKWFETTVEAKKLLPLRLVCRRVARPVYKIPCTMVWPVEKPGRAECALLEFLQTAGGALRSLWLRLPEAETPGSTVRPGFISSVLKLTTNLEYFRVQGAVLIGSEEEAPLSRTDRFFSMLQACQKLCRLHLIVAAVDLSSPLRSGYTFKNMTEISIFCHNFSLGLEGKSGLRLSDEALERLLLSCPKLQDLSIFGPFKEVDCLYLKSPVLRSGSLKSLQFYNLSIGESLTIEAPLLTYLQLPPVPKASVRTGSPLVLSVPDGNCSLNLAPPSAVAHITLSGNWKNHRVLLLLRQCRHAIKVTFGYKFEVVARDLNLWELLHCQKRSLEEIVFGVTKLASFVLAREEKKFGISTWSLKLTTAMVYLHNAEHDLKFCSVLIKAAPNLQHLKLELWTDDWRGWQERLKTFEDGLAKDHPQLAVTIQSFGKETL
jgi:hypothetical protein